MGGLEQMCHSVVVGELVVGGLMVMGEMTVGGGQMVEGR